MKNIKLLWGLTILNTILVIFVIFSYVYTINFRNNFEDKYYKGIEKFVNESNKNQQKWVTEVLTANKEYSEEAVSKLYSDYNSGKMKN